MWSIDSFLVFDVCSTFHLPRTGLGRAELVRERSYTRSNGTAHSIRPNEFHSGCSAALAFSARGALGRAASEAFPPRGRRRACWLDRRRAEESTVWSRQPSLSSLTGGGLWGRCQNLSSASEEGSLSLTAVGFEPTQLALVELEPTATDRSGKLSWRACGASHHIQRTSWTCLAPPRFCGASTFSLFSISAKPPIFLAQGWAGRSSLEEGLTLDRMVWRTQFRLGVFPTESGFFSADMFFSCRNRPWVCSLPKLLFFFSAGTGFFSAEIQAARTQELVSWCSAPPEQPGWYSPTSASRSAALAFSARGALGWAASEAFPPRVEGVPAGWIVGAQRSPRFGRTRRRCHR